MRRSSLLITLTLCLCGCDPVETTGGVPDTGRTENVDASSMSDAGADGGDGGRDGGIDARDGDATGGDAGAGDAGARDAAPPIPAPGSLFTIDHQSTSAGGTTYAIAHGAELAERTDLGVFVGSMGADNGVNIWNFQHVGDGSGWNGRNYMRFFRWGAVDGGPQSGFGWFPPDAIAPTTFAALSPGPIYVRFRIRVVEHLGAGRHSGGMKWFIFGGPGISGERRMIFWLRNGSYARGTDVANTSLEMSAGVSGSRASCLIDNGDWVHVQLAWAYTGAPGGPYMRIYTNNNDIGSPNAEHTAFTSDGMGGAWLFPEAWDTGHWANTVTDNSVSDRDAVFDLMDFQFGTSFDGGWFPR